MLCLNCVHASEEVPNTVEKTVEGVTTNISEELEKVMAEMEKVYPTVVYCAAWKAVVVGTPELPTQRVDECEYFTAA